MSRSLILFSLLLISASAAAQDPFDSFFAPNDSIRALLPFLPKKEKDSLLSVYNKDYSIKIPAGWRFNEYGSFYFMEKGIEIMYIDPQIEKMLDDFKKYVQGDHLALYLGDSTALHPFKLKDYEGIYKTYVSNEQVMHHLYFIISANDKTYLRITIAYPKTRTEELRARIWEVLQTLTINQY